MICIELAQAGHTALRTYGPETFLVGMISRCLLGTLSLVLTMFRHTRRVAHQLEVAVAVLTPLSVVFL